MPMEAELTLSRWNGKPGGIGYRRWVIMSAGIRDLLGTRFFRAILVLAWVAGIATAAVGFLFAQTVSDGGWLESAAAHFGARIHAIATAIDAFVLLYPDICIRALFTNLFWLHSMVGVGLSMVALTAMVPRLVTRDRAGRALTVYLSRPLTTADYLLGKLGTIAGVLALLWTGPLLFGWVLGVLFAPDSSFFLYSIVPLLRALAFNAIGLVALATIVLGVSAVSRSSRTTVILWLGLWLVAGTIAKPPGTPDWMKRASFSHDLSEVREAVFKVDEALEQVGTELPFLDRSVANSFVQVGRKAEAKDLPGSIAGLGVFVALSSVVFFRRLRSE